MQRLLLSLGVLGLSAGPAFAGPSAGGQLATPGILGLAAIGVIAAIYLARRNR